MQRLSTRAFDQPMTEPDELEEGERYGDPSALPDRTKLGAAWLGATVAGIAAIGYSMLAQLPPTYTLGGLGGLLIAYAAYGSFLKRKNTLQFADSLYYMGFLWTVFALIAAFVVWPAPKLTADAVLTTFGYALVATFAGLFLRFVVLQFQTTLPERLLFVQERIDRRVADLTEQIDDATTDITSFRNRASSELGRTLQQLVRSLGDLREQVAEHHRTMSTTMTAGFESAVKDMLDRLAATQIPQDMLTSEVTKLMAAVEKRGADVERAVQQLEKGLVQAADTVTRLGDSLYGSEAAKRIGTAVTELSHTIHARTQEFGNMTAALEHSRTEMEGQLAGMQSLRSTATTVSTQLSTLEAELREVSSHSLSADVRTGILNVHKSIQSSLDASRAIEAAMRGVRSFLNERVDAEQANDGK